MVVVTGLAPIHAGTVTNLPSADTTLFQYSPDGNMGRATTLVVGSTANGAPARALVRFPLAGIPRGARIISAELRIEVQRAPQMRRPEPSFLDVRRVEFPWVEGESSDNLGGPANLGEPTWNSRGHGSATWAEPGGRIGVDVSAEVHGTSSRSLVGVGSYTVPTTPDLVHDVQGWLDDPASNHGWMLMARLEDYTATARRIGAREDPVAAPRLVIGFIEAPMLSLGLESGATVLRFRRPAGSRHRIEYQDALGSAPWTILTNLPAQTVDGEALVSDERFEVLPAARFYRLVIP